MRALSCAIPPWGVSNIFHAVDVVWLGRFHLYELDMRPPRSSEFSSFHGSIQTHCGVCRSHGCAATPPFHPYRHPTRDGLYARIFRHADVFFRIFPAGTIVFGFFFRFHTIIGHASLTR